MEKNTEKKSRMLIVFDLETTGLTPHDNDIIELAMAVYKGSKCILEYDKIINTNIDIENKMTERQKADGSFMSISELTHISGEMVKKGISEKQMVEDFMKIAFGYGDDVVIAGYNVSFDLNFIFNKIRKYHPEFKPSFKIDYLDVMSVYKDLYKQDKVKYTNSKLETAVKRFEDEGVKMTQNTHRAIDDVKATFECLMCMLKAVGLPLKKDGTPRKVTIRNYYNLFGYTEKYGHVILYDLPKIKWVVVNYTGSKSLQRYYATKQQERKKQQAEKEEALKDLMDDNLEAELDDF